MIKRLLSLALALTASVTVLTAQTSNNKKESLIFCDEGGWQQDNGQLSFYNGTTSTLTNAWFRQVNGKKLGDTPNDIIQINDTLLAICVNWSNIIQFIRPDGTACGATEDVPNNRKMATDGRYLYVTSYAHNVGGQTFTKGCVAKIDVATKRIVAVCEVGWEPEGVEYYKGNLYIANSGGYSFQEQHGYETTVSVVKADDMTFIKNIETGKKNLYGSTSLAGNYMLINSAGDYNASPAATVLLNLDNEEVKTFDFPCTYNTTDGTLFYIIGASYSYSSGSSYVVKTIDPRTATATDKIYNDDITAKIKSLQMPYDIYISPYTGNVYFTDSRTYGSAGRIYGYTKDGENVINELETYVGPAHMVALPQAGVPVATGIKTVKQTNPKAADEHYYDLSGRRVNRPTHGIYIYKGKKVVL